MGQRSVAQLRHHRAGFPPPCGEGVRVGTNARGGWDGTTRFVQLRRVTYLVRARLWASNCCTLHEIG